MSDALHPVPSRSALARWIVWAGFHGIVLAAWLALMLAVRAEAEIAPGFWASLCVAAAEADPRALWAMWLLMALAMMLPTFAPALGTYLDLAETGAARRSHAPALVAGFALVWAGAAALGAGAQYALSTAGGLDAAGKASGPLAALLLLGAGAYQFSPLKAACLAKCRMPLTYFMGHWRTGAAGALRMGGELGLACLGCCWALMALAFVGGTMNLLWMGAATLFMIFEKLPDIGRFLERPAGAVLLAAGAFVLAQSF